MEKLKTKAKERVVQPMATTKKSKRLQDKARKKQVNS